jgi:beta-lactamase class A
MGKRNILILLLLIVMLPSATLFSYRYCQSSKENQRNKLIFEKRKANRFVLSQKLTDEITKFKGVAGIVVKDLETGWEFSYEKDKLFPSASLAKIPLMAACFLAADQGRIKLDRNIALKSMDKLAGSGVLKDMPAGTAFSVERLIGLMIYESDNTAANIVTNLAGIDYLNSAFKGFGLKNTELSRKIADYRSRDKGIENYTTAEDIALLLENIYRKTLGNKYVSGQCVNMLKLTRINDRIPKYLPAEITIAHKTGLERDVCHDAGIVFTRKGDFIIVVLTKHTNSNSMSSKDFISKAALHTYSYLYNWQ